MRSTAAEPEGAMKLISVVIPCFNEAGNLPALAEALRAAAAREAGRAFEFVIVDDGSTDGTWEAIGAQSAADPRVRGVRLARNFGHQPALLAGISVARGDAVVSMDADLQHPPELLGEMLRRWEGGAEVVLTCRRDPAELPRFKRATSRWFYRLFRALTGLRLEDGQSDFRLLDRKAAKTLLSCGDCHLFLRGLVQWVGYRQAVLTFTAAPRREGASKYTLGRMARFALDGALSFSALPLRLSIVPGVVLMGFAALYAAYAVFVRLFGERLGLTVLPGWASLVVLVVGLFGGVFLQLGVIGEYLSRIYAQVKNRPRFVIAEFAGGGEGSDPSEGSD
jgi:dolichol-phosphate mannosyltransferase